MPLYTYHCNTCEKPNQFMHSPQTVKTTCKHCNAETLEKELGGLLPSTPTESTDASDEARKREKRIARGIKEHKAELAQMKRERERT